MRTERIGRYVLAVTAAIVLVALGWRYWPQASAPKPAPLASSVAPDAPAAATTDLIARLEARLKTQPKDAEGWRMLGWSYFNLADYPNAVRAYTRAAELEPAAGATWSALGEALVMGGSGVSPAAARAFDRALKLDPKDARARYFVAVGRDLKGDHRGAIGGWIAMLNDAPADAQWTASVRALVERIAAREKIDIAGRLPAAALGPDQAQLVAAAQIPQGEQAAVAQAMTDRLAARLKANPRDAAGWAQLIRSRRVLGDAAGAKQALATARRSFASDAATLAELDRADAGS